MISIVLFFGKESVKVMRYSNCCHLKQTMILIIIIGDIKMNSRNITYYLWKLVYSEENSILVTFVISNIHVNTVL